MSYEEAMAGNTYHRFDSQFFRKEYLVRKQKLKPISEPLHLLMQEGTYGILPKSEDYVATGLPLIRGGDLRRPRLQMDDLVRVPESYFSTKYKVEKGDLLILVKGATIDSADGVLLIDEDFGDIIFNGSVFRIKLNGRLNPYYVMAFMRTSFFTFQKTLAVANNGIEYNSLDSIRNYLIPHFSADFQTQIEQVVKDSFQQIEASQALYHQAEADLLYHLGLPAQPSRPVLHDVVANVKTLDDALNASRWDAEFYQPKYDEQEATIRANMADVRLIAHMELYNARGLQPEYIPDGKIHVVNSRHILETGLDYSGFEKTTEEFWQKQEKARIKRNDILIYTTGANIGRTQVYLQDEKALASNHVNILRLVEGINPQYVAFVMNSRVGRLQTDQLSAGSAQQELYPKDVSQFYIPFVAPTLQEALVQKITQAHELEKESEALLTRAKQAVEVAIEQGEAAGLAHLQTA